MVVAIGAVVDVVVVVARPLMATSLVRLPWPFVGIGAFGVQFAAGSAAVVVVLDYEHRQRLSDLVMCVTPLTVRRANVVRKSLYRITDAVALVEMRSFYWLLMLAQRSATKTLTVVFRLTTFGVASILAVVAVEVGHCDCCGCVWYCNCYCWCDG